MRVHFDVLGWLYVVWGVFGILTGLSLTVLSLGTAAALLGLQRPWSQPEVWLLAWSGVMLIAVGSSMILAGLALGRRASRGRLAALILAVPNLLAIPFGSALGIYTFWTLLNDDARREFGRPTRSPDTIP